jgi:hypothetical protein
MRFAVAAVTAIEAFSQPARKTVTMMTTATTKSRPILRAPYDLDRRDRHCMEAAHFRSFYFFEPDIRSNQHLKPEIQFPLDMQSGVITHDDKPDFRIRIGSRTVGIEITRLFTSADAPALESTQESIFDQACRNAERLKLPPVDVILYFNIRKSLHRADCCRIADAVVQFVAANIPNDGNGVDLEHRPGQPHEVDLIKIQPSYRPEQGRWRADFSFSMIERNTFAIVQKAITKKAGLLRTYLNACDECWLLLVADSFKASGNLDFSEDSQMHIFSSPFARTYALDWGRPRLHCLETAGALPTRTPP